MRSLGELGIGLSVVFCVFVLALVAELCYIFYWKKSNFAKSTSADCLKSATDIQVKEKIHHSSAEYMHEASWVGSFGGYPSCVPSEVGGGGSNDSFGESLLHNSLDPPPHLLFSIKEETKEDMELAAGLGGTMAKSNSRLRSRMPSDVLTIHFTSGSSSPAASVDTPFTTPPSSPLPTERLATMPKLSPFAACAVRSMSGGKLSSPIAEMQNLLSSPATNGRGRTPLRLLFERSPLLGVRPQSPAACLPSPSRPISLISLPGAAESSDAFCHQSPPPLAFLSFQATGKYEV